MNVYGTVLLNETDFSVSVKYGSPCHKENSSEQINSMFNNVGLCMQTRVCIENKNSDV